MAISDSDRESSEDYDEGFEEEEEEEDCCNNYGSDPDYSNEVDSSIKFHKMSIKKKSSSANNKEPELGMDFYENVEKIIKDGRLEKLKVDECKVYLRKNGLRLSGNKDVLIQRIKEHFEISNGGGEKKYPISSFVLNCKGDACTGDVVMFEQNVYEMFNIASRSACGPPCGTRIVAGRIVKESYGSAKQQHTFTIEVLWSKGEKPLPLLHPLLIKGRNLYRLKTLRQRWEDEGERQKVLMEKHSRGSLARSDREMRIEKKERRKMLRSNRILKQEKNKSQSKSESELSSTPVEIQPQQPISSTNSGRVAPQHQQPSLTIEEGKSLTQGSESLFDTEKLPVTTPQSGLSVETQRLPIQQQSECQNVRVWISSQNQLPRNSLKNSGTQECQLRKGDKSMANGTDKFLGTNYYKEFPQLRSLNHSRPATQPQRQGFLSQQLCRYHSQGRCYYGENCEYLHDTRELHVAKERRYQRQFY